MVVLLSHFPGKKLLLVGSIFILHDILRIPRVSNISQSVTFSFNMWESHFRGPAKLQTDVTYNPTGRS